MDRYAKGICIGLVAGFCVLLFYAFSGGVAEAVVETFSDPDAVSMLMYLESGRVIRFQPKETEPTSETAETTAPTEQTQPPTQPQEEDVLAVFGQDDAGLVQVHSYCGYDSDVAAWLAQPLQWDLKQSAPTVLILHSHATESSCDTPNQTQTSAYRTTDKDYNVVSMGVALKKALEARGIGVIHDTTLHAHPSYSVAYANSRETAQAYLDQYPSISLVLDLHRDSVTDDAGNEMVFTTQYKAETVAQLMLVVGTDAGGLTHPDWESNMALAVKLHAQLEKTCAGICRPISFRSQRFNQDISPGALIVEVGGAGNTQQQALRSVEILADAIYTLAAGTR